MFLDTAGLPFPNTQNPRSNPKRARTNNIVIITRARLAQQCRAVDGAARQAPACQDPLLVQAILPAAHGDTCHLFAPTLARIITRARLAQEPRAVDGANLLKLA